MYMFNKNINKLSKKITKEIKCEELKEQLNRSKLNNPTMLNWLWEFSKKIVVVLFVIYVLTYLFSWILILLSGIYSWNVTFLDTLISETNSTFKIVIGGYLIKSMAENVIKIKNTISTTSSSDEVVDENETIDEDLSGDDLNEEI